MANYKSVNSKYSLCLKTVHCALEVCVQAEAICTGIQKPSCKWRWIEHQISYFVFACSQCDPCNSVKTLYFRLYSPIQFNIPVFIPSIRNCMESMQDGRMPCKHIDLLRSHRHTAVHYYTKINTRTHVMCAVRLTWSYGEQPSVCDNFRMSHIFERKNKNASVSKIFFVSKSNPAQWTIV